MSGITTNAIAHEFTYATFTEEGPVEKKEKRWFYFTMQSVKRMYEMAKVDEAAVEEALEKGEHEQGDRLPRADDKPEELAAAVESVKEETAGEAFDPTALAESFEVGMTMMWAGLLAEAASRGEELTIEQVGHMVGSGEELKNCMAKAAEALDRFLSGLTDEQEAELSDTISGGESGKGNGQSN